MKRSPTAGNREHIAAVGYGTSPAISMYSSGWWSEADIAAVHQKNYVTVARCHVALY